MKSRIIMSLHKSHTNPIFTHPVLLKSPKLNDISGIKNIENYISSSPFKNWIKQIPIEKTISFENYNRKNYFIPIAEIILDNEVFKNSSEIKKRKTVIKVVPKIATEEYIKKSEWLYLFLINNHIVKIGGTRVGIKNRILSYLSGHYIKERGNSGDCSKTNGYIYNTFEFYLQHGCKIEMYGYKLPSTEIYIDIFDKKTKVLAQTYHVYESTFLDDYKKTYSIMPILCDNCDPVYRL